jgi:hypothetical protein
VTTGVKARPDFSRDTLLWLAGLLEGEGSFLAGGPACPGVPRIAVEMTDEDVVARVAKAFGVSYFPIASRSERWKSTYRTQVRGESAVRLMQAIRPSMGNRRQGQIDRALACWNPQKHRVRPEDEDQILRLVREGKSYRETGRLTGFSRTAVCNAVARARSLSSTG